MTSVIIIPRIIFTVLKVYQRVASLTPTRRYRIGRGQKIIIIAELHFRTNMIGQQAHPFDVVIKSTFLIFFDLQPHFHFRHPAVKDTGERSIRCNISIRIFLRIIDNRISISGMAKTIKELGAISEPAT